MPYTACFRRYIHRTLSRRERACIENLERQRQRSGRVRALINDPAGTLTRVLIEYIGWHQARLTQRSAVILSPQKLSPRFPLRARHFSPGRFTSIRGYCRPVSQIIIFSADRLKRLGQAVAAVAPLLSGRDTILLIVGNLQNLRHSFSPTFYQTHDSSTLHSQPNIPPPKTSPLSPPISPFRFQISPFTFSPSAGTHPKPVSTAFLHQAARHRA